MSTRLCALLAAAWTISPAPKSAKDSEMGAAAATHNAAMTIAVRRRRARSALRASRERRIAAAMFGGMSTPSIVQHWPHSAQFNNDAEVAASLWGSAFGAVADRLSIAALSTTRKSARAALKSARSWGIGMRGVGLVTLLSVGAVSAAPTARPPQAEAAVPAFVKCVARTAPD